MTAEQLAAANGLAIEFIRSIKARKEDIVKKHFGWKKAGIGLHLISYGDLSYL